MVFFTVTTPTGKTTTDNRPLFERVVTNQGGGYNVETAMFTCPISGLYHFSFAYLQHSIETVSCNIFHNRNSITYAYMHFESHDQFASASLSVYVYLDIGDTVDVRGCGNWHMVDKSDATLFTGALVM